LSTGVSVVVMWCLLDVMPVFLSADLLVTQ